MKARSPASVSMNSRPKGSLPFAESITFGRLVAAKKLPANLLRRHPPQPFRVLRYARHVSPIEADDLSAHSVLEFHRGIKASRRATRTGCKARDADHQIGQVHYFQARVQFSSNLHGARPAAARGERSPCFNVRPVASKPGPARRPQTFHYSYFWPKDHVPGSRRLLFQQLRESLDRSGPEHPRRPGRAAHSNGDLLEGNVLQITHQEDLAIVGGQFLQRVGQQDRLFAAS